MAQQNQNAQPEAAAIAKDKKPNEPLFGPSIGPVGSGPAWTLSSEKKVLKDELTPDIVSGWIEKSKEPSQPTTTLQALVNLKRPTLRLSPLTTVHEDSATPHVADLHHHGLEFEYDCDAPKCGIYVHVHLPKTHPDAPSTSTHNSLSKLLVFETVVDGGFGNRLRLEEGALLELGRFENAHIPATSPETSPTPLQADASSSGDLATNLPSAEAIAGRSNARRRFSHFHFRRRPQNRSISGPALAVVDAEPVVAQEGKPVKDGKEDADEGVKVTIRLATLDEQGTELVSPNEQITYLHIVRLGQPSTEVPEGGDADARPWVVKVVKREATIGPHTFHLHEIFGLTTSSTHNPPPTAPLPSETHTYPPDETQQAPVAQADDEDPQSECLLCLSSPREVVLLPCRHLVACKDCALNMVEFGAGGNITQATDLAAAGGDEFEPGAPAATTAGPASASPAATQRRKRKAKGWFCPVCRQPYTSMLRLTTAPPPVSDHKDPEGSGTEDEGMPSAPNPAHLPAGPTAEVRSGGLLSGALRPGFFRGLSLSRSQPVDVENQAGTRA
ncbi:hypothetical protein M413DRAFT_64213 [Hebeloma cylindrosporum]|uniref:RING-type domain-containing protein n=1 Tax=Hebeloma cylindrosporum TaxID=76867 RepID=A0A0C3CDG0_HEBCY|nr:hypothetical protein M413DRAFT_64213 [Hebeloma cylindrosporum h7]